MAKIRHIAYRSENIEEMAEFFVNGLGMEVVQRRGNGAVDLSDGTVNITLLPMALPRADGRPSKSGIEHIGFTVTDEGEARKRIESAGAKIIGRRELGSSVHYELKYTGPQDIEVDLGHWAGTEPVEDDTRVGTAAAP
jgi:catechol 2,3-dioxygenase-like lactoylglutathione lyase family enzyme